MPLHTLIDLIYHSIWFAFLYSHISLFTSYITHISTFAFPSILRSICLEMVPYATIRAMSFNIYSHIYPDIPLYPLTPIPLRGCYISLFTSYITLYGLHFFVRTYLYPPHRSLIYKHLHFHRFSVPYVSIWSRMRQ